MWAESGGCSAAAAAHASLCGVFLCANTPHADEYFISFTHGECVPLWEKGEMVSLMALSCNEITSLTGNCLKNVFHETSPIQLQKNGFYLFGCKQRGLLWVTIISDPPLTLKKTTILFLWDEGGSESRRKLGPKVTSGHGKTGIHLSSGLIWPEMLIHIFWMIIIYLCA